MATDEVNKCSRCAESICCTYITEALSTPRSKSDFQHLLWQVSHQGVEVYKEDGGWYLLIHGRCQHILPDRGCAIYEQRPQICRDYENDWCELDEPASKHFVYHFHNYEELLHYCRKRFKRWDSA